MRKFLFNLKSIFSKLTKHDGSRGERRRVVRGGVMKVDFLYLCQRRKRMTALAEGLGMNVDEMVSAVSRRVLEDRRENRMKMFGKKR